jgi:5-carboxymethyl-2-hydroxymuconic-semialdehyde dehydrogenase
MAAGDARRQVVGPVPCIIRFKTEEEAVRIANDTVYGLSSYLWTENTGRVMRMAKAIEAGMTFVNSQNVRDLRQPFGGVKDSGIGREGGEASFETFCEIKNVCLSMGSHPIPKWGAS